MEIKLVGGPHGGMMVEGQPEGIRCIAMPINDEEYPVPEKNYLSHIYRGEDGVLSYVGMHWVRVDHEGNLLVYPQPMMEVYLTGGPLDGQRMAAPAELTTVLAPIARSEEDIQRQRNAAMSGSEIDLFKYAHVYSKEGSIWTYKGVKEVDIGEGVHKFGTIYRKFEVKE